MATYSDLQHAVHQTNVDEVHLLLKNLTILERMELFKSAMSDVDYLVINVLLEWVSTHAPLKNPLILNAQKKLRPDWLLSQ